MTKEKQATEDLALDCLDMARISGLTERHRRLLADVADRLMSLEHERDFARFREDSAINVMRKFRQKLERVEAERKAYQSHGSFRTL